MKNYVLFLLLSVSLATAAFRVPEVPEPASVSTATPITIDGPYFSPNGGGEEMIIRHIDAAKKSLYCQAYSFTADKIVEAMIRAKKRGLVVSVVLDRTHAKEKAGAAARFKAAGIETTIDAKHQIAHNKLMMIDGLETCTGSYNFTRSANERNAENVLVIKNADIAAKYITNWKLHHDHSTPYAAE